MTLDSILEDIEEVVYYIQQLIKAFVFEHIFEDHGTKDE